MADMATTLGCEVTETELEKASLIHADVSEMKAKMKEGVYNSTVPILIAW